MLVMKAAMYYWWCLRRYVGDVCPGELIKCYSAIL